MLEEREGRGEKVTYKRGIQEAECTKITEELLIWLLDVSWKMMDTQMTDFRVVKGNLTRLSL